MSENFSSAPSSTLWYSSFGRPRCDMITSDPPSLRIFFRVGSAASIRVVSVILLFSSSGMLKSTRTRARVFVKLMFCTVCISEILCCKNRLLGEEREEKLFSKKNTNLIEKLKNTLYLHSVQRYSHGWEAGTTKEKRINASIFTMKWSLRLSVRTSGFHPEKRGSIPLGTTRKSLGIHAEAFSFHGSKRIIMNRHYAYISA